MSNTETLLTGNKTRTLAGLALRKFWEKGKREQQLLGLLWSGKKYDNIFRLGGGKVLEKDVPVLNMLIAAFGGSFTELWTDNEALEIDKYLLSGQEFNTHQNRVEAIIESRKTPEERELDAFVDYLITCGLDMDTHFSYLPVDMRELVDIARLKTGVTNYDNAGNLYFVGNSVPEPETVDNDAHFEDGQQDQSDGEPLEADYQTDTEPSAILPTENSLTHSGFEIPEASSKHHSRQSNRKTVSKHPKVITQQVKPRQHNRFISGQGKTLDNNIRLWEADNVTGEPKIYY